MIVTAIPNITGTKEESSQNKLTKEQREAVGLLSVGTFLEYFDLMLYVHMAVLLNELFFPKTDPYTASLLSAFAFCSTYVLRPFGALIFGYIGDNIGRKHTVIITTIMMSISCIVMANLPTYAQIGITASWILTICRIIQGMSSMGEVIGSELYVTEITKPPMQYVAVSVITVFASAGGMGALAIAYCTLNYGFNWRMVFWVGAAIAFIGSKARMILRETPEFVDARKRLKEFKSTNNLYAKKVNIKTVLALYFMQCTWPACFYFVYVHCALILKNTYGLSAEQLVSHNFIISIIQVFSFIFFTICSYWIYPLRLLKIKVSIFTTLLIIFVYCGSNISYLDFFILQGLITFFLLSYSSAMPICYKHFPVFKRFTYASMLYAISRSVMYIVTSFGLSILSSYIGNLAIFIIIIPTIIAFVVSVLHFEKLEINAGNYPKKEDHIFYSA